MTAKKNWKSKTKNDLIIEIWEFLDCESVGAQELKAIAAEVLREYGESALESPMITARLLADEGAELRHEEILALDVRFRLETPYEPMFRNILKFADFKQAAASLQNLENLRRKFEKDRDRTGLYLLRDRALEGKKRAQMIARNPKVTAEKRAEKNEIAEWFTIWLNTPEIFQNWLAVRLRSPDFKQKFADENNEKDSNP